MRIKPITKFKIKTVWRNKPDTAVRLVIKKAVDGGYHDQAKSIGKQ